MVSQGIRAPDPAFRAHGGGSGIPRMIFASRGRCRPRPLAREPGRIYNQGMLHAEVTSVSEWIRACSTAFVPLRVRAASPAFRASLAQIELVPGLTITTVLTRASEVVRDRRVIDESPREDLLLSIQRRGIGTVCQHRRTARLTPGAAALYDASAPYTLAFPAQMTEIVLQLPRRAISNVGHAFEDLTARVLQPSAPLRALASLAGSVDTTGMRDRDRICDEAVAEALASLLRASLAADRATTEPPLEAELLAIALRMHVDEQAADPELTPESLARAFHISLRYTQKLFALEGDAPAAYIRRRRLEVAQQLLRSGSSVAEAAHRSGFVDVDTFSRAFKREYGVAPSRERALAAR